MDYLPPYKALFQNAREMSRAYRKQTNSLLLRTLGSFLVVFGVLIVLAVVYVIAIHPSAESRKVVSVALAFVVIIIALPLTLYFSTRGYARAQEIGLAAVQSRDPDFKHVSVWQHFLLFLIVGLPAVAVSFALKAIHLQEFSGLFTLMEVSIFYLAPVAVIESGSAIEGISTSIRLFRANASYVSLCGAVGALVTYAFTYVPLLIVKAFGNAPSGMIAGGLMFIIGSILLFIILFRYEPFYRAQIYQNMIAAEEIEVLPQIP